MFFAPSKPRKRAKILNEGVSKSIDHIQIKIKIPNSIQKPPASSKAPNKVLKDMDILCTFKIKMESQNMEHGFTKDQCSDHINFLIKIPNPIQKLLQPKANHCKAELVF